ncbi:MAG: hypothetical protein BGO51_10885 [Rhodospirillales bacterium 69-11]|nr:hypothetical protein [Rhodospirillales bacterium]OJW29544.1 MAG: hypothetical protein BGO51_10885 [Rhodospirillales bacterium 69-11]
MTSVSCHDAGSEPSPARRLVAVLHLDIVGYTRLIALDDLHTLMRMRRIRAEIVTVEATRNGGVLHQSAGDSLLITFDSIAGAVACSLNIQRRVGEAEAGEPEERRITFRAGIDVGDVIADGSDIHGNGVNVAVRLQSACPVGQVCISRAVHDHLHGQLGVPVQPLGRLPLKNIAEPVEAFVLWVDAHLLPAMPIGNPDARPVTSTPSIATLPFRVLSLNVEDRLLVDGLVEEINHSLAGLKELFVISRGSTLRYDPDHADLAEVARELGVGYILHGSVRRAPQGLRIRTELADASDLRVIRSDHYDGEGASLFELQERIALQVAATIVPDVREREMRRAMRKPPSSLTAYDLVLQAVDALFRITYKPFLRARALLQQAIALDPDYAPAYSYAAYACIFQVGEGWSVDPEADARAAAELAAQAIERDPHDAIALAICGHVHAFLLHRFDEAVHALDRAIEAGPNCPLAWTMSSATCGYLGQGRLAVERAERGLQLSPLDVRVFWPQAILAQAHYVDGDYAQAIEWARRALGNCPTAIFNLRTLAVSLVARGAVREAREIAAHLLEIRPDFRLTTYAAHCPFRGEHLTRWIERLREAGLPD